MATPIGQRTRARRRQSLQNSSLDVTTSPDNTLNVSKKSVSFLSNNENSPQKSNQSVDTEQTLYRKSTIDLHRWPLNPVQNVVNNMCQHLEQKLLPGGSTMQPQIPDKTSPGLARLRITPGGVRERQQQLQIKHHESRSRCDALAVGGGVCMWPEMPAMRLTRSEITTLALISVCLLPATILLFVAIHGSMWQSLVDFTQSLNMLQMPIINHSSQVEWDEAVIQWHLHFASLMESIHVRFEVSLSRTSVSYHVCVILYIIGMATLLYLLLDNIFSSNNLSPKRIKIWVCLLIVLGTWTVLAVFLLIAALKLEVATEDVVHRFSALLGELVHLDLDRTLYRDIGHVWQVQCLPPLGRGVLFLFGLVRLRDVVHYLQYYSFPILTALLTPIIQLVIALRDTYYNICP